VVSLAGLFVYPVKSCRGIGLAAAVLTDAGLEHDREWMIVTPDGRFVTQREEPRLALISTRLEPDALWLSAPNAEPLEVPFRRAGTSTEVIVWRDHCRAHDEGAAAARWLEDLLSRPLRLVRFDAAHRRQSDAAFTGQTPAFTRFADGYAMLAISQASLDDLNARLPTPLPMNRFRPNMVLEVAAVWEDGLGEFGVGDVSGSGRQAVHPVRHHDH
jgi:uncharacterized protein YcbX